MSHRNCFIFMVQSKYFLIWHKQFIYVSIFFHLPITRVKRRTKASHSHLILFYFCKRGRMRAKNIKFPNICISIFNMKRDFISVHSVYLDDILFIRMPVWFMSNMASSHIQANINSQAQVVAFKKIKQPSVLC